MFTFTFTRNAYAIQIFSWRQQNKAQRITNCIYPFVCAMYRWSVHTHKHIHIYNFRFAHMCVNVIVCDIYKIGLRQSRMLFCVNVINEFNWCISSETEPYHIVVLSYNFPLYRKIYLICQYQNFTAESNVVPTMMLSASSYIAATSYVRSYSVSRKPYFLFLSLFLPHKLVFMSYFCADV